MTNLHFCGIIYCDKAKYEKYNFNYETMDIKNYLKENNITIAAFAKKLQISRPTLDAYITSFEKGETIPKEKYQIIFNSLFGEEKLPKEDFDGKLKSYSMMLDRDNKYGLDDLSAEDTDMVNRIMYAMISDIELDNYSKDVFYFIEMLINNYRREHLFRILSEYFCAFNSDCEIKKEQINYFANIYSTMHKLKNTPIEYDELDYKAFLKRREEVKQEKERIRCQLKEDIEKKANTIIEEAEKRGVQLTMEEVIEKLKKEL